MLAMRHSLGGRMEAGEYLGYWERRVRRGGLARGAWLGWRVRWGPSRKGLTYVCICLLVSVPSAWEPRRVLCLVQGLAAAGP